MAEIFADPRLHFWAGSPGMSFLITIAADLYLVIMYNATPLSPNIKGIWY